MSDFVYPIEKRSNSEIQYHRDCAPGTRFLALDCTIRENSPIYVAIRRVCGVSEHQPRYIEEHIHEVDSVYFFLGNEVELRGLQAEVCIDGKKLKIKSPVTVFVPKDIPHSCRIYGGSGIYINIVLHGDYDSCTHQNSQTVDKSSPPFAS